MRFEVLEVNDRDKRNQFFIGEIFEGEWETIHECEDFIDIIVWDSINNRGIAPHKIKILQM